MPRSSRVCCDSAGSDVAKAALRMYNRTGDEMTIPILYSDRDLAVCVKPRGVSSEQGGLPELLAAQLGDESVRCVHRLDAAVGGVMVYARSSRAAAVLSRQIADRALRKEYLAVVPGRPEPDEAVLRDLLFHDRAKNKSYVVRRMRALVGEQVPIILVSAYDWSDIEESAKEAGADGFISKPLFKSTLYRAINELLNLTEATDANEDDHSDIAGMRVLAAEDNDINWEILNMLLDMHGIESVRAENGQIAVDMLASSQPGDYDLVFMDVQMPIMNGIEATKAIRALPGEWPSTIPIIAMTADAFSEDVAKCMDAGMNGHIAKPIDIKIVLKEIRGVKEGKL